MTDRAVGSIEDEVIGHIWGADTEVCFGTLFPLVRQTDSILTHQLPERGKTNIKPCRADYNVELFRRSFR